MRKQRRKKKRKQSKKKQKQSEKKVKTNSSWAFQLLKNISRFAQSGVSSNLWSYRAFPQKVRRGMSWLCFPSAWPSSQSSHQYFAFNLHIQVGFCLIARSQNYTNLPDSWICGRLRVFAGVLRIFAGVLRVILGAVMCIYMRWCSGYENGLVCPWDAARMQAMFSQSYSKCHLW